MRRAVVSVSVFVPFAVWLLAAGPFASADGPAPTSDAAATTTVASADPVAEVEAVEMLSYGIGHQVGRDFSRLDRPLDREALLAGIRDAMARAEPRFTSAEMQAALRRLEEDRPATGQ